MLHLFFLSFFFWQVGWTVMRSTAAWVMGARAGDLEGGRRGVLWRRGEKCGLGFTARRRQKKRQRRKGSGGEGGCGQMICAAAEAALGKVHGVNGSSYGCGGWAENSSNDTVVRGAGQTQ
jgi:hypothetical protein